MIMPATFINLSCPRSCSCGVLCNGINRLRFQPSNPPTVYLISHVCIIRSEFWFPFCYEHSPLLNKVVIISLSGALGFEVLSVPDIAFLMFWEQCEGECHSFTLIWAKFSLLANVHLYHATSSLVKWCFYDKSVWIYISLFVNIDERVFITLWPHIKFKRAMTSCTQSLFWILESFLLFQLSEFVVRVNRFGKIGLVSWFGDFIHQNVNINKTSTSSSHLFFPLFLNIKAPSFPVFGALPFATLILCM